MIFHNTWQQVLDGTKTQTRRLFKPSERLISEATHKYHFPLPNEVLQIRSDGYEYLKWQVDRTYAVQPGRGKPALGRIRIIRIRCQELRYLTNSDAIAEGCYDERSTLTLRQQFRDLWNSIHTKPGTRWQDNPLVWVLEFELVQPANPPTRRAGDAPPDKRGTDR